MAKYIYKTPTSSLQWIQKNYQNVYKGFIRRLRSYGLLFHDICWPVYFGVRGVRVARGAAECNSSLLSALQTSQVLNISTYAQLQHELIVL